MEDYLSDMALMQRFAALNRQIIKEEILDGIKLSEADSFIPSIITLYIPPAYARIRLTSVLWYISRWMRLSGRLPIP